MITDKSQNFNRTVEKNVQNVDLWNKVNANIGHFERNFDRGKKNYKELELEKKRVEYIRKKNLFKTEQLLIEFETNFQSNGGKVLWACNSDEAQKIIGNILSEHGITEVFKTKSATLNEIGLTDFLKSKKVNVVPTEFGDYVAAQTGTSASFHFQYPLIDKTKEEINGILSEKCRLKGGLNERQLSSFIDKVTYKVFMNSGAAACISGANFLISDEGGIAFTENEGNILKCLTYSKIHIVVAGFDKVLSSLNDWYSILSMLSVHTTGQALTAFNTVINGFEGNDESPEKTYVIILDNNRTEVLKHKTQRQALTCIHCGACLNVCPVYKNIGGSVYNSVYSGPIGSVLVPLMNGMQNNGHLVSACTLCGKCVEVCPVKINIPNMLLASRREIVTDDYNSGKESGIMKDLVKAFDSRKKLDNPTLKSWRYRQNFAKLWGPHRELPKLADKSFSQYWSEANPKGEDMTGYLY